MFHFITFGDGSFDLRAASRRLGREALATRVFQTVASYDIRKIRHQFPEFIKEHGSFLRSQPRGLGYWLWKPYLISQLLSEIPEEEILVYIDAGCELNIPEGSNFLSEFNTEGADFAAMTVEGHGIREWTSSVCLSRLSCPEDWYKYPQFAGGFVAFRNNPTMRGLASRWYGACIVDDYSSLMDVGVEDRTDGFVEHRHDQSIYSILLYDALINRGARGFYLSYSDSLQRGCVPFYCARNRTGVRHFGPPLTWLSYRLRRKASDLLLNSVYMKMVLR